MEHFDVTDFYSGRNRGCYVWGFRGSDKQGRGSKWAGAEDAALHPIWSFCLPARSVCSWHGLIPHTYHMLCYRLGIYPDTYQVFGSICECEATKHLKMRRLEANLGRYLGR